DKLCTPGTPPPYFNEDIVKTNGTGIRCPYNDSTIRINAKPSSPGSGKPIHASHFKIERPILNSTPTDEIKKTPSYRIGQSPPKETCMDFLVAGLESGLGIFQFVSERTHTKNTSRSNTAVIQLLLKKREENGTEPLELGNGRFKVEDFKPDPQSPADERCLRYLLTVTDKNNPGQTITVPVTQAGLPFQEALLSAASIVRASAMMDQHKELLTKPLDGPIHDPLILSHAGYGRNATLMTYRELCLRIEEGIVTEESNIEQQVCDFIQAQRKIRPGFVHSLPQVRQLVIALEDKLRNHLEQSSQLAASTRIHHARSSSPARRLSVVPPAAAATPLIGTSGDTLGTMQVDVIAIKRGDAVFPPIGTQPQPLQVFVTGLPPKDSGDRRPYLPHQVMKFIDQTLTAAAKSGLKSVGFAASLLAPTKPTKHGGLGIPFEQMAALAVAAVDRHAAKSGKQISVTFQCTDEAQQAIVDDVIKNRAQFKVHQNFQALLRLPNNMSTPIPATAFEDFGDPQKRASFAPVAFVRSQDKTRMFRSAKPLPKFVNGSEVPLARWEDVPISRDDWQADDKELGEPDDIVIHAAGVVIEEDDGRVWVVAPTGGFAGMKNTFPKGQIDRDKDVPGEYWSPQATARKEAYEESGLQVELTGFLYDNVGDSQNTRYYRAKRIGGTPADVGWESQAVHLVPRDQLRGMMTWPRNKRENNVLESMKIPHDETGAITRLEELLCGPEGDVDGELFSYMAQEVSEAMRYIGEQRKDTGIDLVPEDQVLSRDDSRQPQKSTALRIPGATGSAPGYLHANRIELGVSRNYIAAQYPLSNSRTGKENRDDFWRAATDSKLLSPIREVREVREVSLIVDLTQLGEKWKDNSYAPVGKEPLVLPTYELRSSVVTPLQGANPHISESMIQIKPHQGGGTKEVQRMHFTAWPDKKAIKVDALIDLANQVKQNSKPGDTVLIHCSHGVGRTGTLITFLAASEKIETAIAEATNAGSNLSVSNFLAIVRDVLIKGRQARGEQFVATVQFPLIIKALLEQHFDSEIVDGMLNPKAIRAAVA
ncbi:MAG: NUDIX domain-containing protein, partial [Oxalobacteraceae bacterium]|nr:NUDIX domain-containing protein [Oxalobacteraceae bacterium]